MPFQPSSPTRLYSRRKSTHTSSRLGTSKGGPQSTTEEFESVQKASSKTSVAPPAVEEPAAMPSDKGSTRNSMSPWRGAIIGRTIDDDGVSHTVNDGGQDSRRSVTSTITPSPSDAVPSASTHADNTKTGLHVHSVDDTSPNASSKQSSLFDNTSESEYSIEEDNLLVVGRASSVRVSKPQIVQHKPTKLPKPYGGSAGHCRSDSHSSLKAERIHGQQLDMLPSTPEEGARRSPSDGTSPTAAKDPQNTQQAGSRRSYCTITPPFAASNKGEQRPLAHESTNTAAALPTGNTLHSVHPSILNCEMPSNSQASVPQGNETAPAPVPTLSRAMSSPLPLPGKGLSRRVSIRPADLIIKNHNAHNSFRESIVTTPYPPRTSTEASSVNSEENEEATEEKSKNTKEKGRRKVSFSRLPSEASPRGAKDRFPSPERPEVLFIDLNLLSHPSSRTTIEIQIADKGTFDDELFFQQIRASYSKQLLGLSRLTFTLVRRIGYVSITAPADYNALDFDSIDFIKHFQNPRLGHKRKAWVIWLRNNNPRSAAPMTTITHPNGAPVRQIDNLNRLSVRSRVPGHSRRSSWNKSHHSDRETNNVEENKRRFSTASNASSFHFFYSPAVPRLPFLIRNENGQSHPTSPTANATTASPCRSFFWPSNFSALSAARSGNAEGNEAVKIVTVSFHYEYRAGVIALLTLLAVLQAVLASVIWVVFGVPGTRPGMYSEKQLGIAGGQASINTDWRVDARSRVLTGVVIGLVVLVMGGLVEGALLWGSWLLL